MQSNEDKLKDIVQWQQASIDAMVAGIQHAERRNWSMFILGLIIGYAVRHYT